jgi:hypothetical protein
MTFWIILILSLALNGALGYWIYTLKKGAFANAATEIKEAAEAVKDIGSRDTEESSQRV